ncbi:EF-P 5-aminopentanol modification-associated protein YfmF [Furfurilactobacillus entadae]|uniref:EF-P 5-aminopentanol modification-associated protein YfmF n=1 Tax=Furfurilactobacillus entadae TaxID=2922307 RepID=UPI0035EA3D37
MEQELTTGVHLTVIPTTQFKTISILISYSSKARLETLTTRSLLADLMETSSAAYPTQTALASALSDMYGANFSTNVTKSGDIAQFQFALTVPNGRYLQGHPALLNSGVTFLDEVIHHPLLDAKATEPQFDTATFTRQQENLAAALTAVSEDKMLYTRLQAQQLHFGDVVAAYPSAGRLADVAALTPASVYAEYQRMIAEDEVRIYVIGDVDEGIVGATMRQLDFAARDHVTGTMTYKPAVPTTVTAKVEHQPVAQAKLDLLYYLPVDYGQALYYSAQVFNGLFGGTPLSLLFTNVREKQSLAYYASSSINFFNQTMTVQTGIDGEQADLVTKIIGEQLADLTNGRFSDQRFHQVKETLINQREAAQDAPRLQIGSRLLDDLSGHQISVDDWVAGINAVTPADVTMVARLATLATTYLLKA